MDDDNGLELSLGLSFGGSSGKTKGNNTGGSQDNNKTEEGDKSTKVMESFKNFLHPSTQKHEASASSQQTDSVMMPRENFFNDLSGTDPADTDASMKQFWVEEDPGNKRKLLFPEPNNQKKHEKKVHNTVFAEENEKTSHKSLTEDGSTEGVAESEVSGSSDVPKQVRSSFDADVVQLTDRRRNNDGSAGKKRNGVPFSADTVNVTSAAYQPPAKDSSPVVRPGCVSGQTPLSKMQSENSGSLPVMFGYSPVQLPILDKDGFIPQPQRFQTLDASRSTPNSAPPRSEGKPYAAEEESSNQNDAAKGSSANLRTQATCSDHQLIRDNNDLSLDFSAIKPGIAAEMKFGGSGACPNLPWVSTTGSGPHGRTISGVTYRFSADEIRIVCACHGSHMSPQEFVQHAHKQSVNPETSVHMTAASAQS